MNYERIELEQGTPEWLAFRKNHIGASDAPIIMGASPWKTPYKLWQEKLGLIENGPMNRAMQRGHDLEQKARDKYTEVTGIDMKPAVVKSKEHPFMIASLDGMDNSGRHLLEIKCPGAVDHNLAIKGIIPKKYIYQLIQQMLVMQREKIDYFSFRSEEDYAIVSLSLEDVKEEAASLVAKEKEFWKCVQTLEEPERVEEDFVLMEGIEWNLTVGEYLNIKQKLKNYEAAEKECRERLLLIAEGKNAKGGGLCLTQHIRKGSVDYSKIPELEGIDTEKYRKSATSYWKVSSEGKQ